MKPGRVKLTVFFYFVGMVALHAGVFWNARQLVSKGYPDFTIYYAAGTMIRGDSGRQLYDPTTQYRTQAKFASGVVTRAGALPYNHPPFEALLFEPLTYFSYPVAFYLWAVLNLATIVASAFILRSQAPQLRDFTWPLWILGFLGFTPIFLALVQGQDSIVLLLLCSLSFLFLRKNFDAIAGLWLGFGLFKPHFVVTLVVLLLAQKRTRILWGFLPVALLLALISTAVVGVRGMLSYPAYVILLEKTMARGAIVPSDMPNVRGMLYVFFHGGAHFELTLLIATSVLFVLAVWHVRSSGGRDFDLTFSFAVIVTVLISYHALGYDLSVLLIPILLLANELRSTKREDRKWPYMLILASIAVLWFPPLYLLLLIRYDRLAFLGWMELTLLVGMLGLTLVRRSQPPGDPNTARNYVALSARH